MRRLIIAGIALLLIAASFIAFYRSFDQKIFAQVEALKAIPPTAAMVIETDEIGELWRDLADKSLIWQTLQATDLYFRLNASSMALDSLLRKDEQFRTYLANLPLVISTHITGVKTYDFLFVIPLEENVELSEIQIALGELVRSKTGAEQRKVEGIEISALTNFLSDRPLQFFLHENLLVLSLSPTLIEESVRSLLKEKSIWQDPNFQELRATRGLESRGQLYVQYAAFRELIRQFVADERMTHAFFQTDYADWSAFDIRIDANALLLNGFVVATDSANAWLNTFRGTRPVKPVLLDYMPLTTAYFTFMGFGEILNFQSQQQKLRVNSNTEKTQTQLSDSYRERCNCEVDQLATEWIGDQMAHCVLEPVNENDPLRALALFRSSDQAKTFESLQFLANAFASDGSTQKGETYLDRDIFPLPIGDYYGEVLSEMFSGMADPYYVLIDDVVLLSASRDVLREAIRQLDRGENLSGSEKFADASDQLSESANFMVYSSLARSTEIYPSLLKAPFAEDLRAQSAVLQQFPVLLYQAAYHKGNKFYNTLYLHHSTYSEEVGPELWAITLQAPVAGKWHTFTNHNTGATELLVQDSLHRLYLLSTQGKIYWDKQLDGAIAGDVGMIDGFKNKKYQMVFATASTLYALDRNGQDLENFPVKFPSRASTGAAVMDYDKDRTYRFVVGSEGGDLWAYNLAGKLIDGWKFAESKAEIISTPTHIRIRNKDYIFALSADRKVFLLNRKGEIREKVKESTPSSLLGEPMIYTGTDINKSGFYAVDSLGSFIDFPFGSSNVKYTRLSDSNLSSDRVALALSDHKPLIALAEANEITIYKGSDPSKISAIEVEGAKYLSWHTVKGNLYLTVLVSNSCFVFDAGGEKVAEFSDAAAPPMIGEFNGDGKVIVIFENGKGEIIALPLEP